MEWVAWSSLGQGVGLPFSPDFFIMGFSFLTGLSFCWGYMVCRSGLVSTGCGPTLRVRVFLMYVPVLLKRPWSLRGSREYAPHGCMVLMAGTSACCMQYVRCCPMVPVQVRFMEPLATTVGEWWRHHSL